MSATPFRFVSTDRRVREDRRFVAGKGRFAADVVPGGPQARGGGDLPASRRAHRRIDKADGAGACRACITCSTAASLPARPQPLLAGLDTPNVPRRPLAVDVARYAGEWVAAVVADTRALAEDAAELVRVEYEPLPFVLDGEDAYAAGSPLVHEAHGSNVLLDRTFVWGEVEQGFRRQPASPVAAGEVGPQLDRADRDLRRDRELGPLARDARRLRLDPDAALSRPGRARAQAAGLRRCGCYNDVDVGGSYGVKRGIKHAVLVGYLSRRLGFPVRLIEDRLENMRGGDAHGPERNFDLEVAFDDAGVIRSMKMRALDNVGAYAGRSPFQLGKPVSAIVGPYRIKSVQYRAIAVTSNKTMQEAVRAFGQAPTNYAIERAIEEVAKHRGLDRLEVRRRNLIRARAVPVSDPERHHLRQRRLSRRHRQGARPGRLRRADRGARPAARAGAARRHRHRRLPRAERRQFDLRAAAQSQEPGPPPISEACRINVDLGGAVTATMHTHSAGQGHETLVGTVIGEVLEIDPDRIRVVRPDSLSSLPSQSPVGSRMAIMLGGAAFHAAQKLKDRIDRHRRARPRHSDRSASTYGARRCVFDRAAPQRSAELDRARHHRAPQLPSPAARHRAGARVQPRHAGADRAASCRPRTAGCRCIRASRSNSI